jgi:hypothetical protein
MNIQNVLAYTNIYQYIYIGIMTNIRKRQLHFSNDGCHTWSKNCLPYRNTWVHPRFSLRGMFCSIYSCLCNVWYIVVCLLAFFPFGHYIVCRSSIYSFWLSVWYPMISYEWGKGLIKITTNGRYPWSLWHRNSVKFNQVMVATVKLWKWKIPVIVILMSVVLRYTASDYPFGIFKHFWYACDIYSIVAKM